MLKERSTKFDAGEKPKLLFFEKKKKKNPKLEATINPWGDS